MALGNMVAYILFYSDLMLEVFYVVYKNAWLYKNKQSL